MATPKKDLPPIVPVPTDYSNLHISKEEFIEKRRKLKEHDAKVKAFAEQERVKMEIPEPDVEQNVRKPGRPKKAV